MVRRLGLLLLVPLLLGGGCALGVASEERLQREINRWLVPGGPVEVALQGAEAADFRCHRDTAEPKTYQCNRHRAANPITGCSQRVRFETSTTGDVTHVQRIWIVCAGF